MMLNLAIQEWECMEVDLQGTALERPLRLAGYLWWTVPLLDVSCVISPKILTYWLGTDLGYWISGMMVLKKFVPDKGFGFISPDDGSPDVFAHTLQFTGDADNLRGGEKVTFETEWDEKKQKARAVTWSLDASAAVIMRSGMVKKYFSDKAGVTGYQEGDRVKFDAEWDEKKGNHKAVTWYLDIGVMPMGQVGCMQNFGFQPFAGPGPYGPMGTPGCDPRFAPYGAASMQSGMQGVMPGMVPGGMPGQMGMMPGGMPGMQGMMPGGMPGGMMSNDMLGGGQCGFSSMQNGGSGMEQIDPSGLPPGWEQMTDASTGKLYFCNRATGEQFALPLAHSFENLVGPLLELGHYDEAQRLLMRPRLVPRQSFDLRSPSAFGNS
eukprot:g29713.t1